MRRMPFSRRMARTSGGAPLTTSTACCIAYEAMGLAGILLALGLLIWLAYRGWSVLLLAPAAALVAAAFAREPLLAHWTQTFMGSAARFLAQFSPIFLLGALFAKLMDDSGSVSAIADYMTRRLGERRAILAVVLAGAAVTYGGVSLFVAFFVLAPMAHALFQAADIPHRLMPATIALGASTFTMSALPGTPAIQNAIPMPHAVRGARSWNRCCGHHAGLRPVVPPPRGEGGAARWRRLRTRCKCRSRRSRRRPARA